MVAVVWKAASFFQEHVATRRWKEDPTKIPEIPGEDHAELAVVVVAPPPVSPAISGRTPRSRARQRSRPARPRRRAIASSSKRSCSGDQAQPPPPKPPQERPTKVPEKEFKAIAGFRYSRKRRCPLRFNWGFGDKCKNEHICVQCGGDRSCHGKG